MKKFFSKLMDGVARFLGKIPGFFRKVRDFWRRHKHLRRTVIALLLIALALWLFVRFWPPFSARISGVSKLWYVSRAVNYDGETFFNMGSDDLYTDDTDPYADRTTGKDDKPEGDLPTVAPALLADPGPEDLTVTWFGHSTVLLQMSGKNILFDPVFTDLASPVPLIGSHRYSELVWEVEDLPYIDYVIITHDHYDHLDMGSVKALKDKTGCFIVPLGIENDLKKWDIPAGQILTMAWWEEEDLGDGLTLVCTPAEHYSGRNIIDKNKTLWAGYLLMNDAYKVFESGDTGFGEHFEEIRRRYGEVDLALVDCAQYSTRWHGVHMFPEEAVETAKILGADTVMPIHWGAFSLSDHAWDDPPHRLTQYAAEQGLQTLTPQLGQTVDWQDRERYAEKWWEEIG